MRVYSSNKRTPLHVATNYGIPEVIKCLLETISQEELAVVMEMQDQCGSTPIHYAALGGKVELLKHFLSRLPPEEQINSLNTVDRNDCTPLDLALSNNHTDAFELLKKYKSSAKRSLHKMQGNLQMKLSRSNF